MTWSFTRTATNSYRVVVNRRDGSGNFSNNITVANGAIDKIKFFAYNMQAGDSAQPYFNDLLITTTTADLELPVINLASGVDQVTWVAKGDTINLANSDVTATDNSGTATVTFSPATVETATDGLTKVTYTATDPSGNTATVTRVIAVGDAEPGWRKLNSPRAATINTNGSATIYGQIYIDGATPNAGPAPNISAELGLIASNSITAPVTADPSTWTGAGVWRTASFNPGFSGGDDEYQATISGSTLAAGTYLYAYRFKIGNGAWRYAGINAAGTDGGPWDGTTHGNGVLTVVPVRNVTFAVDMGVQIFKGLFHPATNGVEVKGQINGTSFNTGFPLARQGTSTIYTNTIAINGSDGTGVDYKFFGYGTNELAWEARGNRSLTLPASDTNLPTVFFSDVSESRKITFRVDMSVQSAKNAFNTNTGVVHLAGSFNDWNTTNTPLTAQGNGIYAAEVTVDGPVSGISYKFLKGTTTGDYEDISNRTISTVLPNLESSSLNPVLFGNDDGVAPTEITLSANEIAENNSANATVGTFSSTDATVGGDTHTYSLVAGSGDTDNASFTINGDDLRAGIAFDYETKSSYSVRVRSTDSKGNFYEKPFTISVTDVAEGSTFAGWSSNAPVTSELVGKYAIGAASNVTAAPEAAVILVDSNTLSLSAIVRTNDTKLKVEGEAGGSLAGWSTNGVSMSPSANTSGVPEGHQRQVFSVDRANSPDRQFLRLKATLQP